MGLKACCGILGPEPKPFLGKFLGFLLGSRTVVLMTMVLAEALAI
jgi:hypothetical protein